MQFKKSIFKCFHRSYTVNLFILIAAMLTIITYFTISDEKFKNTCQSNSSIPTDHFLKEMLRYNIGRQFDYEFGLSPFSAYEFKNEIVVLTTGYLYGHPVRCLFFDENLVPICPSVDAIVIPECAVHCPKRTRARFMSLSMENDTNVYQPVPITNRMAEDVTHFFSACLAPMYGYEPRWLLLVEYIEHYKLQGVTHFSIYVHQLDTYTERLLESYIQSREVEVIRVNDRFTREETWLWQDFGLEECINRHRTFSKWVAFFDLDERAVATGFNGTLADYLRKSDSSIGAHLFTQQIVLINETLPETYTNEQQVSEWLPTIRYHNTSSSYPNGFTAKLIADPQKAFVMGIHKVIQFYPTYKLSYVSDTDFVSRHYREYYSDDFGRKRIQRMSKFGPFWNSKYPENLGKPLLENIQSRLKHVYDL